MIEGYRLFMKSTRILTSLFLLAFFLVSNSNFAISEETEQKLMEKALIESAVTKEQKLRLPTICAPFLLKKPRERKNCGNSPNVLRAESFWQAKLSRIVIANKRKPWKEKSKDIKFF